MRTLRTPAGVALIVDERAVNAASSLELDSLFGMLQTLEPLLPAHAVCVAFAEKDVVERHNNKLAPHLNNGVLLQLPEKWRANKQTNMPAFVNTAVKVWAQFSIAVLSA